MYPVMKNGRKLVVAYCLAWVALGVAAGTAQEAISAAAPPAVLAQVNQPFQPFPFFASPQPTPRAVKRKTVPRARSCDFPWRYSRGLGRCVCLREGYALKGGRCVAAATAPPETASATAEAGIAETVDPGRPEPSMERQSAANPQRVDATLVQSCLKEAGYLHGEVTDTMDAAAWTAFWYFKQDHPVGPTRDGIADQRFQEALFPLCPRALRIGVADRRVEANAAAAETESAERGSRDRGRDGVILAQLPPPAPRRDGMAHQVACLPQDLLALIGASYGETRGLRSCEESCLAVPAGLSKREARGLAASHGITWCQGCVELDTPLPLDDITRLEKATHTQVCVRPPNRLARWGWGAAPREPYTRVRGLYRDLRPLLAGGNRLAVIIGNRDYKNGLAVSASAHNNAGAVYALLSEQLGYAPDDIIDLRDATLEDLRALFGSGAGGELERRLSRAPETQLLIYYSGHGATSADRSETYLLPVDAVPNREARTAFSMAELYASLRRLQARSVLLLLETSFGRDYSDFVFPPNAPEASARNAPLDPVAGLTVIAAADRGQKTLDDPQYGIGLFTRYLIQGLAGEADMPPIGNGDRRIDTVELFVYTSHWVRLAARKSYGLLQNPVLSRQSNLVIGHLQPVTRR